MLGSDYYDRACKSPQAFSTRSVNALRFAGNTKKTTQP